MDWKKPTLSIRATGRGHYQRTQVCSRGFPRGYLTRQKRHFGFQTGDQVIAVVTKGKKIGTYTGRVAVRKTGSFNIQTSNGVKTPDSLRKRCIRLLTRDSLNTKNDTLTPI